MHNTLTIDGRSQSLPNGPFHWTHIADGRVTRWSIGDDFDYFDGAHDGYAPTEHRRRVLVRHGDLVVVADTVNGHGAATRAAAHWQYRSAVVRSTSAAAARGVLAAGRCRRITLAVTAASCSTGSPATKRPASAGVHPSTDVSRSRRRCG